jgi:hypothetical protein
MNETGKTEGVKFVRVDSMHDDSLDIELSNGNIILLQTKLILALPGFGELEEDDRIFYPRTDGETIYWRFGPRPLSVEEITALVGAAG